MKNQAIKSKISSVSYNKLRGWFHQTISIAMIKFLYQHGNLIYIFCMWVIWR
jgi:hypothetical protein